MFDLTIYPISLEAGREQNELPGLLVTNAPRRAARMRAQDHLILHVQMHTIASGSGEASSAAYTTAQQQEMLRRLADTYFNFSGSVTAGLRAVATRMNDFLLSRNLKATHEGQTVGIMNMVVVHGNTVTVGHAGPTHTFVLGKNQVQHFDDGTPAAGMAGRGLGLSRVSTPRFYQASLEPGDLMVVCPQPPAAWSARTLASSPQLTFDHIRRRLLAEAGVELHAALIRFGTGKGLISYWKPRERSRQQEPAVQEEPAVRDEPAVQEEPAVRSEPAVQEEPVVRSEPVERSEPEVEGVSSAPGDIEVRDELTMPDEPAVLSEPEDISEPAGRFEPPVRSEPAGRAEPQSPGAFEVPGEYEVQRGAAPEQAENIPQAYLVEPSAALGSAPLEQPISPRPHVQRGERAQPSPAAPGAAPGGRTTRRMQSAPAAASQARPRVQRQPREPRKPLQITLPVKNALRRLALGERFGSAWRKSAPARLRAGGAVAAAARRAVPQRRDPLGRPIPLFNLTAGTMLAVAVIIPLVVVAVATAVYFEAGRGEQYAAVFVQAQQYAQQAMQQEDPLQQRESWSRAFELGRKAERYQQTDESRALIKQSQDALDALEGYTRLDFRPAVTSGFTSDVRITRMIATLNDVYLLDGSQGRILRLFRTATGYELDATFLCGPGKAGTVIVGPLIDLAALSPTNDMRASVLGIDGGGNLVYCSPNVEGFDTRPLALPDLGWGSIQGMSLYGEKLYVLDPKTNGVYYYDGVNGVFDGKPRLYFGDTIPKMADVIDLAIDQEFLYLLHDDGQMTICEGGGYSLAVTRCTDTPYGDTRAGYEASPLSFVGTRFTQIQTTQPPDPSLFALDVANRSVYHLSLRRLNLQRQYLPQAVTDFPLPETIPSAFAVAPNRRVLLAFDNLVYFALIP